MKYYSSFVLNVCFKSPLDSKAGEKQKFSRRTDNGEESVPGMDFSQSKELPVNKTNPDSLDITSNSLLQELTGIIDVSSTLSLFEGTEYLNKLYFLNPIKIISDS